MKNPLEHGLFDVGNYLGNGIEKVKEYVSNGFSKLKRNALKVGLPLALASYLAVSSACAGPAPTPTPTPRPTPTPTAIPTPQYSGGLPFNNIFVNTSNCTQVISVAKFSRSQNPQREGWDIVEGILRYHNMPNCGTTNMAQPYTFSFYLKSGYGADVQIWTGLNATWEGGGNFSIRDPDSLKNDDKKLPYDAQLIPFKFEVPKIVKDLNFELYSSVSIVGVDIISRAAEEPERTKTELNKIISSMIVGGSVSRGYGRVNSAVGKMKSEVVDETVYSKWFESQLKNSGKEVRRILSSRDMLSKYVGKDVEITTTVVKRDPLQIALTVRNMSTTKDIELDGYFTPTFLLVSDGRVILTYSDKTIRPIYRFEFERKKLPPDYSTSGMLTIQKPYNIPPDSRYMIGDLNFLGQLLHEKELPVIVDLEEIKTTLPTPTPRPIVPTPTPRR